jgi:hypothetical protein
LSPPRSAAIGLRAKTGRAIGIVLAGPADSLEFVDRRELALSDPAVPDSGQPHHVVMELPWPEAQIAVRDLVKVVERSAVRALKEWIADLRAQGFRVSSVGIVGAPERKLEKIGNYHIRAHAAEGVLFRHALEVASEKNDVAYRTVAEKSLNEVVSAELRRDYAETMRALGKSAGRPWRADERAAATLALLALAARGR